MKWKIKRDESISLRLVVVFVNVILSKWRATYEDKMFLICRKKNCTNATLLEDTNKIAYRDEKMYRNNRYYVKSVTKIRNAGRIFYKLEKAAILYLLKQLYFMDTFIYQILPS